MRPELETEFASEEKRARDLGKVLDSLWAGADRALVASQSSREVVSTKGFDHGERGASA